MQYARTPRAVVLGGSHYYPCTRAAAARLRHASQQPNERMRPWHQQRERLHPQQRRRGGSTWEHGRHVELELGVEGVGLCPRFSESTAIPATSRSDGDSKAFSGSAGELEYERRVAAWIRS